MDKENNKRDRCTNFSKDEEGILISLAEIYRDKIQNKKTDAVTWEEKEITWQKIEAEFLARTGVKRTVKNLKEKFENLKKKAKKELAEIKQETYKTGGGVNCAKLSGISERFAALIGTSATGLHNNLDSDAAFLLEVPNTDTNECEVCVVVSENENCSYYETTNNNTLDPLFDDSDANCEKSWSTWKPSDLKNPISKSLQVNPKKRNREKLNNELVDERAELLKKQIIFYENEEKRAQEKHTAEMKQLEIKQKIMEIELQLKEKDLFEVFRSKNV